MVLVVVLDYARDPPGKRSKDSLARAHALLLEDGWGDAAELEPEVVLLPGPPVSGPSSLTLVDR